MFLVFEDRPSDSPFVERVWRCHSERAGRFHSIASPHWEMAVTRHRGKIFMTLRGPETRATMADCPSEGEWLGIRFRLGTFMPQLPVARLINRNDIDLPHVSARSFWLDGSEWEYPDFENADDFVARLVKARIIARDSAVEDALAGDQRRNATKLNLISIFERTNEMPASNKTTAWIGYGLSGLVILFMLFDGGIKLVPLAVVIETTAALGYPSSVGFARGLGILALACTALYAYPRTAVLGAVLLTGYLGGAVATHVRIGSPIFSHLLFGVYLGILLWGGLYLRDERLRALFPFRSS